MPTATDGLRIARFFEDNSYAVIDPGDTFPFKPDARYVFMGYREAYGVESHVSVCLFVWLRCVLLGLSLCRQDILTKIY